MKNCSFGDHEHKPMEETLHHYHRTKDKRLLKIAFFITLIVMFAEFTVGFIGNSLALLSDAVHMFTHAFALLLSLLAIILASKKAPKEKTFGYYRVEVLAAFINGLTLLLSVVWILYEAFERVFIPKEIDITSTLAIAVLGFVVNVITGVILMRADQSNINLRSAFLHMVTDALSSLTIILSLIAVYYTKLYIIDTIIALIVAGLILRWSKQLLSESINILLEASPVDIEELGLFLEKEFPELIELHDIHIWQITHRMFSMTAHMQMRKEHFERYEDLVLQMNALLKNRYGIVHTTFQVEWEG